MKVRELKLKRDPKQTDHLEDFDEKKFERVSERSSVCSVSEEDGDLGRGYSEHSGINEPL